MDGECHVPFSKGCNSCDCASQVYLPVTKPSPPLNSSGDAMFCNTPHSSRKLSLDRPTEACGPCDDFRDGRDVDIHCHTPKSQCCGAHEKKDPCFSRSGNPYAEQSRERSAGAPQQGLPSAGSECLVPPDVQLQGHCPEVAEMPQDQHSRPQTVSNAYEICCNPSEQDQPSDIPRDQFKSPQRCVEQQTYPSGGISVEQQTTRGLERNVTSKVCSTQEKRTPEPSQPKPPSACRDKEKPVNLNHLNFREKQLVMTALGRASSEVNCANMFQERDKNKSGYITRRDFQTVMDKIGVLKDMSAREVDAVFKAFPSESEMELDYNKFVNACQVCNKSPREDKRTFL